MNGSTHRRRVTRGLLTGLFAASAGFAAVAQPAFPGENQPVRSGQTQTESGASAETSAAVPGSAPGIMIYIDPKTGAILKEPAPGTVPLQLSPQLLNALSTSHQGLVEVPSSVPGGGVKVDLQGRFQSPLFVTIDANGEITMQHLDETPESSDRK